jgi:site-specific DNA-methyltransferase (adenine-specific)
VLDPFSGSGTTGEVALKAGRNYIGLELNPDYAAISEKRLTDAVGMFGHVEIEGTQK